MKRKIYNELLKWKEKESHRTALLIDGARRVGKSYIAEKFGANEYKSYILIDFFQAGNEVKDLFENYLNDLDTFFKYLSAIYNTKLYEHNSLIIFDEIQFYPRARAAIKYLVKDGRYSYLETGSLVSIKENVKDILIPSEERHIKMYPMDFEEFLWAIGNESLMEIIRENYDNKKPMGQVLHRKAMTCFRQYLIIGGMPQAVSEYVQTDDLENVDQIKRNILTLYRNDISKHAIGYERKVTSIFDEIPSQLQKHEKRFTLSSLGRSARFREYENSFLYLDDSMIINTCYNSTAPNIGLKLNRDNSSMKIYLADTGLLISHTFDEESLEIEQIYSKLLLGKLEINEGMIFENIVAQMLVASGHKLYFYSNPSRNDKNQRMEIDFLISKRKVTSRHNISPIEVKSGKRYTLSSINKFKTQFAEQLDVAYVIHTNDYKEEDGIIYLPVYMTPLL